MRVKRDLVLALGLLVAVVLAVWLAGAFSREPMYKGKPVEWWVDQACAGHYDGGQAYRFQGEVRNIGSPAVPYLVDKLQTAGRWRWARAWLEDHWPTGLQRFFPNLRPTDEILYGAATTLNLFGPEAKDALPALRGLSNQNDQVRLKVAGALWSIGRETNAVLQTCTNLMIPGTMDGSAMNAAALLIGLGPAAAPAVPFALAVLHDTNRSPDARGNAVGVLGAARISSPEIRAALLDGSKAQEAKAEHLRCECGLTLWRMDPQYAPLGTRLTLENIVTLRRQFPRAKWQITGWLKSRDLDPKESIPTLKQLLEGGSPEIREIAVEALQSIDAESAVRHRGK